MEPTPRPGGTDESAELATGERSALSLEDRTRRHLELNAEMDRAVALDDADEERPQ